MIKFMVIYSKKIFGANGRLGKMFEIVYRLSNSSKRHCNPYGKIQKFFLRGSLAPKILKKFMVIHGKEYTPVNFFRIFGANVRFLSSKRCFSAFIFSKRTLATKTLKKFTQKLFFFLSLITMHFLRIL